MCAACGDTGMIGWEKPMGNPPTMVFVPQFCQCERGQELARMNSPDYKRHIVSSAFGCICPPGANLQCKNPLCPRGGAATIT